MTERQRDKLPTNFSVRDFQPRHTWRDASVGPSHTARVEKQNPPELFVARDVRVPVQENIDIIRRSTGWNVLKANLQSAALKINNQRPLEIAVAISAHNPDARSGRPQFIKNRLRANIAKVPDFLSVFGHLCYALRQVIMSVRDNEHAPSLLRSSVHSHITL
jgi:hypothetical protein